MIPPPLPGRESFLDADHWLRSACFAALCSTSGFNPAPHSGLELGDAFVGMCARFVWADGWHGGA